MGCLMQSHVCFLWEGWGLGCTQERSHLRIGNREAVQKSLISNQNRYWILDPHILTSFLTSQQDSNQLVTRGTATRICCIVFSLSLAKASSKTGTKMGAKTATKTARPKKSKAHGAFSPLVPWSFQKESHTLQRDSNST